MNKELKDFNVIKGAILTTKLRLPYYTLNEYEYAQKVLERKKEIIDNLEKSLKALEIIKEKEVDVYNFSKSDNAYYYNWLIQNKTKISNEYMYIYQLSQEEYDLLKEVLL